MYTDAGNSNVNEDFIIDYSYIVDILYSLKHNRKNRLELLHLMEWYLKRHLYLEEKAIFEIYKESKNQDPIINFMIEKHDEILGISKRFANHPEMDDYPKKLNLEIARYIDFEKNVLRNLFEEYLDEEDRVKYVKEFKKPIKLGIYPLEKLRNFYHHEDHIGTV